MLQGQRALGRPLQGISCCLSETVTRERTRTSRQRASKEAADSAVCPPLFPFSLRPASVSILGLATECPRRPSVQHHLDGRVPLCSAPSRLRSRSLPRRSTGCVCSLHGQGMDMGSSAHRLSSTQKLLESPPPLRQDLCVTSRARPRPPAIIASGHAQLLAAGNQTQLGQPCETSGFPDLFLGRFSSFQPPKYLGCHVRGRVI